MPFKILAFNSSPRKERRSTNLVMDLFLSSAESAGANVEKLYVIDLNVRGCLGCFSCWWETPGKCVHRDDMDWVLPKMVEADAIVFGTPVYHYNIVHYLQRLRERTLPLNLPDMVVRKGETRHSSRFHKDRPQSTAIVAVCGFPDLTNFNQVGGLFPDAAKIFLPASWTLSVEEGRQYLQPFIEAVKAAGKELVETGSISNETQGQLTVDYSNEMKDRIRNWYNTFSARRT
jgi:multimeric flavodoxin WrbA